MTNFKSFSAQSPHFLRFLRLGKEFIWIAIGQAVAIIGGLIGLRLLTNYLSPATFGEIALILTIATLINQLLLGPMAGAALRFLSPAHEAGSTRAYLTAMRQLLGQVTLLILLFTSLVCIVLLLINREDWLFFVGTAVLYALLTGYNAVLNGMQNALRQRKVVAWHAAAGQWLQVIFVLTAVINLGATSQSAMIGYIVAAAAILPSQLYFFRHKILSLTQAEPLPTTQTEESYLWQQKMRTYALPFVGWGFFTWAQMSSDRWALKATGTTSEVGYFAVLYRLGYYPINLLTNLIIQLLTPILFQKAGDATDRSRMNTTYRANNWLVVIAFSITAVAVLGAFFLHDFIFSLFVAPEYNSVSWLLPWVVLAGGLTATGQIATISLLSESETKRLLVPKIGTAVLGTALNFTAAYYRGLSGVVLALSLTAGIYLAWVMLLAQQRQRSQPPMPSDDKKEECHETTT